MFLRVSFVVNCYTSIERRDSLLQPLPYTEAEIQRSKKCIHSMHMIIW